MERYQQKWLELAERLMASEEAQKDPAVILAICNDYVAKGRIEQARNLIDEFLTDSPENVNAMVYQRILAEPDPLNVADDRHVEITEAVFAEVSDEMERFIGLGQYYQSRGMIEKAQAEFEKAYREFIDG